MFDQVTVSALIWVVIVAGFYHGINPAMGWPLSVSAGLMERKHSAFAKALLLIGVGHLFAMLVVLLPFGIFSILVDFQKEIRIMAGSLVCVMGVYLLFTRRHHPRALSRIQPSRLVLWSFLAATAHGAGLMLLPIFIAIYSLDISDIHSQASHVFLTNNIISAVAISIIHTSAMVIASGVIASVFYFFIDLKFLSKTWINLDKLWALSLIAVGLFGILSVSFLEHHHHHHHH